MRYAIQHVRVPEGLGMPFDIEGRVVAVLDWPRTGGFNHPVVDAVTILVELPDEPAPPKKPGIRVLGAE